MTNTLNTHSANTSTTVPPLLLEAIEQAVHRIPPLWPLSRFVAVNPFVGLSGMKFPDASSLLRKTTGTLLAMPPAFYRERYRAGLITPDDLEKALREISTPATSNSLPTEAAITTLVQALEEPSWQRSTAPSFQLPSAFLDATQGGRRGFFATAEISKWCCAYFDEGQALWSFPWKGMPLFTAWKEAASLDCNPEVSGIAGWRNLVRDLPADPLQVIASSIDKLHIGADQAADVFHSLLLGIGGWAGHLQFLAHEKKLRGETGSALKDLLAIRLVYELGFQSSIPEAMWKKSSSVQPGNSEDILPAHLVWQRAQEYSLQRGLFQKLALPSPVAATSSISMAKSQSPAFQAIFCIDVRSEVFRRALEKVAPDGQTLGFAGFFGFPVEVVPPGESTGTPQCPVLLTPAARVLEHTWQKSLQTLGFQKRVKSAWKSFKSSAVSSFVFVEMAGLGFLPRMLRDLLHRPHDACPEGCSAWVDTGTIPLEKQIAMAAGALLHLGFRHRAISRVVLICGHGSSTENNPYGSSLDCGACGGHTGEANARTAAAILNNPAVRAALVEKGFVIPAETWFLAGLHNTTTDEATLFDMESVPSTHEKEIALLQEHLLAAGLLARKERAPLLGLDPSSPGLKKAVWDRSQDWSQVRPEWGLAGNYAFIVAPRDRTRHLDLKGRVFLNDYTHKEDKQEATLELLLSAPVVVASWINLQYFASTVDNRQFGSGDKTLHNVAGLLGVYEGNGGDLRTGLPFQSVHDGTDWRHDPVRLHVCVEAPKEAIDRILQKHPSVADLVSNSWIHLFAMSYCGEHQLVIEKSNGMGGWTRESLAAEPLSMA